MSVNAPTEVLKAGLESNRCGRVLKKFPSKLRSYEMVGLSRTEMNFVATFIDSLGGVWAMMSPVFIFSHFSRLFRGTSALGVRSNFSGMNLKRFTTAPPQRRPRRSHLPQTGSTWSHLSCQEKSEIMRSILGIPSSWTGDTGHIASHEQHRAWSSEKSR